jgi:hypothetical protein
MTFVESGPVSLIVPPEVVSVCTDGTGAVQEGPELVLSFVTTAAVSVELLLVAEPLLAEPPFVLPLTVALPELALCWLALLMFT